MIAMDAFGENKGYLSSIPKSVHKKVLVNIERHCTLTNIGTYREPKNDFNSYYPYSGNAIGYVLSIN